MDKVEIKLEAHGTFIAKLDEVNSYLNSRSKRYMVNLCLEYWPEVFTRKELQGYNPFVLATILNQI